MVDLHILNSSNLGGKWRGPLSVAIFPTSPKEKCIQSTRSPILTSVPSLASGAVLPLYYYPA